VAVVEAGPEWVVQTGHLRFALGVPVQYTTDLDQPKRVVTAGVRSTAGWTF
jgi:hypothetical protein